jgi:hypothetical protein
VCLAKKEAEALGLARFSLAIVAASGIAAVSPGAQSTGATSRAPSAGSGVACAPAASVTPTISFKAKLGSYSATVSGIRTETILGRQVYVYASPVLTVVDPAGKYSVNLGGKFPNGITGLSPSGVGPARELSPLCLVSFAGAQAPTVIVGVGGPGVTLVSSGAYVVAVQIGATGVGKPVTDLSLTGGQMGLGGQRIVIANGHPLLAGKNGAFGYYGAFSAQPPIVVNFAGGRFVNVTRSYPTLVSPLGPGFWASWQGLEGSTPPASEAALPSLTAWSAVESVTGQQTAAYAELASLEKAGWVTAAYVQTTEQLLVRTGYATA